MTSFRRCVVVTVKQDGCVNYNRFLVLLTFFHKNENRYLWNFFLLPLHRQVLLHDVVVRLSFPGVVALIKDQQRYVTQADPFVVDVVQ